MKKNILITGISRGIGKYLAQNLGKDFEIFGISRTTKSSSLFEKKGNIKNYYLDLTDFSKFLEFFEQISKKNLKFDVIIFNAGVGYFGDFKDISEEKYLEMINLNLASPIIFLQKIFPFLEKKAKIIFMGSISGKKFFKSGAVYQASKFGLRGFAGALKNEFPGQIYIINPKLVKTDFHRNSKIEIDYKNERITELKSILEVVENIILGKEKRFEIDL